MLNELNQDEFDSRMMREALREAERARREDEVPVGAVLVFEGRVLIRAHNQVERLQDATAHAELLCIAGASAELGNWRLTGCTLYCTLEPCAMCSGAIQHARIANLVYGASDLKTGTCGSVINLMAEEKLNHHTTVKRGLLAEETGGILSDFFKQRRLTKKL